MLIKDMRSRSDLCAFFNVHKKQRVAIARALIHNRSILLVDEGTSALDKQNADIVERSLLANPDATSFPIHYWDIHYNSVRKLL